MQYLIAVRRDFGSSSARAEKMEQVRRLLEQFTGAACSGDRTNPTIVVETTPDVLAQVQSAAGPGIWIEAPQQEKPAYDRALTL